MLPKGSPFLGVLNAAIVRLREGGGLDRLRGKWLGGGGGAAASSTEYAVPAVALGQVALSISILSALAAAAAAVFAFELCFPKLGGVRHVDIWAVD